MAEPFLAEIRIFSFGFAPRGWAMANGQLLPINQNQALFSLLGTTYGGNGQTNFSLPNLQDRTPIAMDTSQFGTYLLGATDGEANHTLTLAEMSPHTHGVSATSAAAPATATGPENALPASAAHQPYRSGATVPVAMKPGLVANTGGGQAHNNLQPFLTLNFCIALQGIFPSRP